MPIEREFKFILHSPDLLVQRLQAHRDLTGYADIRQGYLSRGGRVRSRTWWMRDHRGFYDPDVAPVEYIFTYKHDLQDQPGCLEIETAISEGDFQLAWSDATHKIHKTRYLLREDARVWEVDLFKDPQGAYLAMAELEVPQDHGAPQTLHPLIQAFLVHRVDENDGRFKNRNLCLREPVEKLLKEIV